MDKHNTEIAIVAVSKVKPGKLEEFTAIAAELVAHVESTEEGALSYRWFVGSDNETVTVIENYASSEAILFHAQNYAAHAARLADLRESASITVFGNVSEQLAKGLSAQGVAIHSPLVGFAR